MLSKHRISRFRTILGVVFCLASGTLALTHAPSFARTSVIPNQPVTLWVESVPARGVIADVAAFANVNVVNLDSVDASLLVTAHPVNVPASVVFERLLFCAGLGYVEVEGGIELVQTMVFGGVHHCQISADGQAEVSAESMISDDTAGGRLSP